MEFEIIECAQSAEICSGSGILKFAIVDHPLSARDPAGEWLGRGPGLGRLSVESRSGHAGDGAIGRSTGELAIVDRQVPRRIGEDQVRSVQPSAAGWVHASGASDDANGGSASFLSEFQP